MKSCFSPPVTSPLMSDASWRFRRLSTNTAAAAVPLSSTLRYFRMCHDDLPSGLATVDLSWQIISHHSHGMWLLVTVTVSSWQAGCQWLQSLCSFTSIIMMTVHTWLKLFVMANYSVKHGHIWLASTVPHVWILISGYVRQWHYYWQRYHGMNNSGIAVDSIIRFNICRC